VGHSQSGHSGEEKNSQPLPGHKPLIIQPVAQCYTTELFCSYMPSREEMLEQPRGCSI